MNIKKISRPDHNSDHNSLPNAAETVYDHPYHKAPFLYKVI